jgi:hypothetical protein
MNLEFIHKNCEESAVSIFKHELNTNSFHVWRFKSYGVLRRVDC